MCALYSGGCPSRGRRAAPSWTPRALASAALWFAVLISGACAPGGARSGEQVSLSFDPEPRVGEVVCTVTLTDAGGAPLRGASIALEGNMNHAGMVPVFGEAVEAAPGTYQAPMEFTMGGDWFFIVRAELEDGRAIEEIVDVAGVPAGHGERACCSPPSE